MEITIGEEMRYSTLTVAITVYNCMPYLQRCLESLANQTYEKINFIIIDDGSTDGSENLCDFFSEIDSRFTVLHKNNEGLVRARKEALENVDGEYVAFVDGDDWVEKDAYKLLMEIINHDDSIDMVDAGYVMEFSTQNIKYELKDNYLPFETEERKKLMEDFLRNGRGEANGISHMIWSKIYKKTMLMESYKKVPDNCPYSEDALNFIFLIPQLCKIATSSTVLYHYNIHEESMSCKVNLSNTIGYFASLNSIFFAAKESGLDISSEAMNTFLANGLLRNNNRLDIEIAPYVLDDVGDFLGKRIILYGAGIIGKCYYKQLSMYMDCSIVLWVDKDYKDIQYPYARISPVDEILGTDFDYVLICTNREKTYREIKESLINKGVEKSTIIWQKPVSFVDELCRRYG